MDRFEDLQTFVAVADQRSVRKAAERLDRAPSVVNRRIKDLEARLSTQLLICTTRQIRLTGAGERFLCMQSRYWQSFRKLKRTQQSTLSRLAVSCVLPCH